MSEDYRRDTPPVIIPVYSNFTVKNSNILGNLIYELQARSRLKEKFEEQQALEREQDLDSITADMVIEDDIEESVELLNRPNEDDLELDFDDDLEFEILDTLPKIKKVEFNEPEKLKTTRIQFDFNDDDSDLVAVD